MADIASIEEDIKQFREQVRAATYPPMMNTR